MAKSIPTAANREWVTGHLTSTRVSLLSLAPVLVVIVLFKLAISDGGRDLESLTLAQTLVFMVLAAMVWAGAVRRVPLSRPLVAMLGAVAFATLWSVRPEASVRELLLWTMYAGIAIMTASTLTGPAAARRFLDAAVFVTGWLCLVALFAFWGANNPGMRWYSTFYWPNPFAAFLLLVLPLEFSRCVHARRRRDVVVHGATTLLFVVSLLLTYSRGGWIALGVIVPAAAAVLRPPSWGWGVQRTAAVAALAVLAVGVLTGGSALQGTPEGIVARAVSVSDGGDVSIQGRLHFWRSGLAVFWDHPVVGTGPGTFGAVHSRYQRDVRFYAKDAHNLYIQTLAETGLLGATALLALLTSLTAMWLRTLRQARGTEEYPLVAGVGLGLVAFYVHSAMDMDWMFPANPTLAFALSGVLAWYDRAAVPGPVRSSRVMQHVMGQRLAGLVLLAAVGVTQAFQAAQHHFVEGQDLARTGQWSAAARQYADATRWNPLNAKYLSARAAALAQGAGPGMDLAADQIRRAIVLDRMNASHPLQLAQLIMLQRGNDSQRLSEAQALLQQALGLDPLNRPEAYRLLAHLYLLRGQREQAEQTYRAALRIYEGRALAHSIPHLWLWPEVASLHQEWAALLASSGRMRAAIEVLEALLAEDPTWAGGYADLAQIYLRQGRPRDADRVLRQGMGQVPTSEVLWVRWRTLPGRRTPIYER